MSRGREGQWSSYLTYRGREGQWSFYFHRITGLGVLLFLAFHIVDTALIGWGPEVYDKVVALYRHPVSRVGEVALVAAVLYHALNGVRIILVDFWEEGPKLHRQLFYAVMVLFVLLFVPTAYVMLRGLL